MKLLAVTQEHAKKPVVRVTWGAEAIFFAGEQPSIPAMIALELPGLKVGSQTGIHEWLEARKQTALARELWRPAVLDDLLDARNGGEMIWQIAQHFTLAQITAFTEAHGPSLLAETKAALAAERAKRASVLRKLEKRTSRIIPVIHAGMMRVPFEARAIEIDDDRSELKKLSDLPFDASMWIDACGQLQSDQVKTELLARFGHKLVKHGADIPAVLDRMIERGLDKISSNTFWSAIEDDLPLRPTVRDEAIDLTKAREITVVSSWAVWKARRVGPIKIGRAALAVTHGDEVTYVRGERKLLHRIRERGGSITRWGNTLVVGRTRGGSASAHEKLLEVDRIDTLAQVDPAAAARLAGDLGDADPIATALARATAEPTWRRILADLLIERLVGIDADVARRLARAQSRANRR